MKVRIEIDTKTFVRFWLVVIGLGLALLGVYMARTALIIIGIALFLALALNRPVAKLAARLPGKSRVGGTALAFTIVITILGMLVFLVIPPIVQQTVKFVESAPQLVETFSTQWSGVGALVDKYQLQPQIDSAVQSFRDNAAGFAADLSRNVVSGLGSVFSFVAALIIVLTLTFLLLIEGPEWVKRFWGLYRDRSKMRYHRQVAERMYSVFTGYIIGQLTVAGIGALSAGAVVFLLSMFMNVPANLAFPTVATVFTLSMIPMFGATLAGVVVALLLGLNDITAGVVFAIYFVIYQQIENNMISPAIQSKRIDLSPLAILVAVTIGLYVFGLAGGIISIPIAGCIKVLVEEYLKQANEQQIKSEKPLAKLVRKIKSTGEQA